MSGSTQKTVKSVRGEVKIPSKQTVNLAMKEKASMSTFGVVLMVMAIVALALAVAKFGVIDQYRRLDEAEAAYRQLNTLNESYEKTLENYADVLAEYRGCSNEWMESDELGLFVTVDRQRVLDLIEDELMTRGTVKSLRIIGSDVAVTMSGMNLQEIAEMLTSLRQSPIVADAALDSGSTEDASYALDFSLSIALQSDMEVAE